MVYGIYAIKDNLNGFMNPVVDSNDPTAVRNFAHAMSDVRSFYYTHPSDYSLYQLGDYDTDSGHINAFETPKFVIAGSTVFVSTYGGEEGVKVQN